MAGTIHAFGQMAEIRDPYTAAQIIGVVEVVDACLNVLENKGFEFETDGRIQAG